MRPYLPRPDPDLSKVQWLILLVVLVPVAIGLWIIDVFRSKTFILYFSIGFVGFMILVGSCLLIQWLM